MIAITYNSADRSLAQRILNDLRDRGMDVLTEGVLSGQGHILIAVFSPQALDDRSLWQAVEAALDQSQHVLPVLAEPVELPDMISHLQAVDFSQQYRWEALEAQLKLLMSPDAPRAMRVLTSRTRAANRRTGLVLAAIAAVVFGAAIYMIAVLDLQMPAEEYAAIDTQVALTRDFLIGPTMEYLATVLPRSTEQAQSFPATLDAIPEVVQPFVAATATTIHEQLGQLQSGNGGAEITPTPEAEAEGE
ncbi:MAG: TIR domain-containing protein [Chloroflexota bacterium]|nr:MAG: hypothetical protein DIU68_01130 [Chloroflexota bacterium]